MKSEVANTFSKDLNINLNYCGNEICDPTFSMGKHVRHEYLIHYLISGSGTYYVDDLEYSLKAGDVFIVYPNTLVSYKTNPYDPFHFCWFAYSGSGANNITKELGFNQNSLVRHLHKRYSIKDKIDDCINLINSNTLINSFQITSILFDLFSCISNSFALDNQVERDIKQEHVERAASYIQMNYMLPINVDDVIKYIRLDRTYLSKIFHIYKGVSIRDYITQVRLNQAKLFLETTYFSAKEIAKYVGFEDECYFSRVFKKLNNISPLEYREQVLEIERGKNND